MKFKLGRRKKRSRKPLQRAERRLTMESLERREVLSSVAWTSGPSLPSARTDVVAVVAPDNALLVLGGDTADVPKLGTAATSWSSAPNMDKALLGPGAVRTSGGGMFVYGGMDGTESTDEAWTYDYVLGDHQNIAQLGTPRADFGAAADSSNHAYAIGGINSDGNEVLDSVEQYSPSTDAWEEVATLPAPRHSIAAVADDAGHIYVFGGSATAAAGDIQNTSFRYDIATDSWNAIASLPIAVEDSAAVMADNGSIYVLGGLTDAGATAAVQVYDPATDSWTSDTDLPQALYSHAAAMDGLSRIVVAGGTDATGNAVNTVYRSQRFDIPETAPVFTSNPITVGSLDSFYSYDANATANPEATYSLVVAPVGMTINPQTGFVSWQPVDGQEGLNPVTVRAENRVGFLDQGFVVDVAFDTTRPSTPTALTIDGVTTTSVDLSWQPSTDNRGVAYYEVLKGYRSGWRGRNTSYRVIQTGILGTSTTVPDLDPLSSHKLVVRAVDVAGNVSYNSNQVIAVTQAPPTLRYYFNGRINGEVSVVANHSLSVQLSASANPTPTYALLSGPSGMTLDPNTGLLEWTPTAADVGGHLVTVEAVNSVGSDQLDIPITVAADLPVLAFQFNPNGTGSSQAVAGSPFEILVSDLSLTPSTFELVDGPAGMTIDPNTGLIQWAPTPDDAGPTTVTVRGTNSAGSTNRSISFETFFTTSPTNIQVTGETLLYPTVSWTAPTGVGSENITGYSVRAFVRYRWGRAWRSHTVNVDVPGGATSTEIQGLLTGKQYLIAVYAYDANGNRGLLSTEAVTVTSVPAIPNVSWTVTNPNGGATIANQPVEIQLNNLSPDPATFELVDGPAGLTLDSVTGLATWTPGVDDIGSHSIHFRAINSVGPRDITVGVNVLFSGAVGNVTAIRNGNSADVSWTAPTDNVEPIAYYKITMHWTWSSRRRSRTVLVDGSQLSATLALIPTGAVWHRGVTIAPVDEFGRIGETSPFEWYA